MKRFTFFFLKLTSFLFCFVLLFCLIQRILIPKYVEGSTISTANIDAFYSLEKDSIDVLFLGASQMYSSVNAKMLNEEYGIKAFDFGASSQTIPTTLYYLKEALKTQSPKLVMVEVCDIYWGKSVDEQNLAWNYSANKLSKEKSESLIDISDGDLGIVTKYSFPLLQYHSRWCQLNKNDFHYDYDKSLRGYAPIEGTKAFEIMYLSEAPGKEMKVPDVCVKSIKEMARICAENRIKLVFFKVPISYWTRNDSKGVKKFMTENGLEYIDLYDHLDEIGIDNTTDFFNNNHSNSSGANKTTRFIAEYIKENFRF